MVSLKPNTTNTAAPIKSAVLIKAVNTGPGADKGDSVYADKAALLTALTPFLLTEGVKV